MTQRDRCTETWPLW